MRVQCFAIRSFGKHRVQDICAITQQVPGVLDEQSGFITLVRGNTTPVASVFVPQTVFVTPKALEYPDTPRMLEAFRRAGSVILRGSPRLPRGLTAAARYARAKTVVVLTVDEKPFFRNCRPSADYELNLVRGCPGMCEYCYLQTAMGSSPYIRISVNVEDILEKAGEICRQKSGAVTFEGSSVSDPVPVERYTKAISRAISFFAKIPNGYLRVVTKFTDVGNFFGLDHRRKTRMRYSLEAQEFHQEFERGVPSLEERLEAARTLAEDGYPIGFVIAPVFLERGLEPYERLLTMIKEAFASGLPEDTTLEFVTHRFTERAKSLILARRPGSRLPMREDDRLFKMGRFGYGKYVYPAEKLAHAKTSMTELVERILPGVRIEYFV